MRRGHDGTRTIAECWNNLEDNCGQLQKQRTQMHRFVNWRTSPKRDAMKDGGNKTKILRATTNGEQLHCQDCSNDFTISRRTTRKLPSMQQTSIVLTRTSQSHGPRNDEQQPAVNKTRRNRQPHRAQQIHCRSPRTNHNASLDTSTQQTRKWAGKIRWSNTKLKRSRCLRRGRAWRSSRTW